MARYICNTQFTRTSFTNRPANEDNDCAVMALMNVTDCAYNASRGVLREECGRKTAQGTTTYRLMRLLDRGVKADARVNVIHGSDPTIFGHTFTRVLGPKGRELTKGTITLQRFLRENPTGKFYCFMAEHAFAVVNGKLVDFGRLKSGSRVTAAWKVTPVSAPAAPATTKPVRSARFDIDTLTDAICDYGFNITAAQMEDAGFPASAYKHAAYWGKSNKGGQFAAALGLIAKLRTINGQKVLVLTSAA